MLEVADRKEAISKIKEWYYGYIFGDSHVYCPWDIINYISDICDDRTAKPQNYWGSINQNEILLKFVKQRDFVVTRKFEILLNGRTVCCTINDKLTYDQLRLSEDYFWSIVMMNGYVTKAAPTPKKNKEAVLLKIPNKEIVSLFRDTVIEYFKESVDSDMINKLVVALYEGNESQATEILSKLLWKTVGYNNYQEDYYQIFLKSVFEGRGYDVEFNAGRGLSKPDIILKDKKNESVIIIKTKRSDEESDMDKDADEAINQIINGKYAEGIKDYKHILCYGVSFFRKQDKVKLMKK